MKPETQGIVTADDLMAMKPTASFINTSRAALVAPGAVLQAWRRAARRGWRWMSSTPSR